LEENYQDTVLWLTSEQPLPPRLADWCVEIPVSSDGRDLSLERIKLSSPPTGLPLTLATLEDEITIIYKHWLSTPATLSDVKRIRAIVYGLLHRNIRWTDGFHQWMFALECSAVSSQVTQKQKVELSKICISQPFTGPGQTVPSYRIPILWENYLLNIRNIMSPPDVVLLKVEAEAEAPQTKTKRTYKKKQTP
jgi:hypothetical protein